MSTPTLHPNAPRTLVIPPHTDPTRGYRAVTAAANPDDVSTTDKLTSIGADEAEDRRIALTAQHRWENEGGALRPPQQPGRAATPPREQESRHRLSSADAIARALT